MDYNSSHYVRSYFTSCDLSVNFSPRLASTERNETVRNLLKVESRSFFCIGVCSCIAMAFLVLSPGGNGQEGSGAGRKPIILVTPFENQSKQNEKIDYQVGNKEPKRSFKVDRYTMAPRALLEDTLSNIEGVTIIERQRVDTLLLESDFGQNSGLVDPEKAIKLCRALGANLFIVGTIVDLSDETKKFEGYGIITENTTVTCQMRIRLLEFETGKILFSKVVKGSKTYTKSNFGGTGWRSTKLAKTLFSKRLF